MGFFGGFVFLDKLFIAKFYYVICKEVVMSCEVYVNIFRRVDVFGLLLFVLNIFV